MPGVGPRPAVYVRGRTVAESALERGLRGSAMLRLSVDVFRRHAGDDVSGMCVRCGWRSPCPARRRAAVVIAAAGEDPRAYLGESAPAVDAAPTLPAQVAGYRLGGAGRRAAVPHFDYER